MFSFRGPNVFFIYLFIYLFIHSYLVRSNPAPHARHSSSLPLEPHPPPLSFFIYISVSLSLSLSLSPSPSLSLFPAPLTLFITPFLLQHTPRPPSPEVDQLSQCEICLDEYPYWCFSFDSVRCGTETATGHSNALHSTYTGIFTALDDWFPFLVGGGGGGGSLFDSLPRWFISSSPPPLPPPPAG